MPKADASGWSTVVDYDAGVANIKNLIGSPNEKSIIENAVVKYPLDDQTKVTNSLNQSSPSTMFKEPKDLTEFNQGKFSQWENMPLNK